MARDLFVTSPRMRGEDILKVQTRLASLGYVVGMLDGVFGPVTAGAVSDFQRVNGLDVDGCVGPNTRRALDLGKAKRAIAAPERELGRKALAEAIQHIGVREDPPSSNRTPFGEWFGANGYAWCNMFVSYCFVVGADYILCDGYPGGRDHGIWKGKGCAYVPTTAAWLRATGQWVGLGPPQAGDIAIFNWDGREPDHIGIVEKDLGNGTFNCIEGNTSAGDFSNGGSVMRTTRYFTQVDGFGRVR